MTRDYLEQFSREQNLAQVAGVYYSTNHINLLTTRSLGEGNPICIETRIDETFAGGTRLRIEACLFLTAPGDTSDVVIGSTADIPIVHPLLLTAGPLLVGSRHSFWLDKSLYIDKIAIAATPSFQYLGVRYTLTGDFTTGKVTTGIIGNRPAGIVTPTAAGAVR